MYSAVASLLTYLEGGECEMVEDESQRLVIEGVADVWFVAFELLQRVFHPHHGVVEVAHRVRDLTQVNAVLH